MLSLFLCILILITFISMFLNFNFSTHLASYISQVIVGYAVIILHIGHHTFPIDLIATMLIGVILLHVKHKHLFQHRNSVLFLKRLYLIGFRLIVFMLACYYISFIPIALNVIFLWVSAIAFSSIFTFIGYALCSSAFLNIKAPREFDTILVLGAGIFTEQVTPMLACRLDKALRLFEINPEAIFIVSGGQGPDEPISEARAMQRYLIHHGVNPRNILLEDKSTSTLENIMYTAQLIQDSFAYKPKIVCVTSQFHIMRALHFGEKFNLKLTGVGSHTPYHFFEIALIRDFLALMYQYKMMLTIYFATLFFICIIAFWHIPQL
ncbi:YdcF family protein [Staphylococcus shinii]|uniref:YdcF family protein n=1 Tax=Staphylococcus shinii TaxID=2912228 RepID=UPI0015E075F7|nr:YdcF family protein [Staphylococcus shinii]